VEALDLARVLHGVLRGVLGDGGLAAVTRRVGTGRSVYHRLAVDYLAPDVRSAVLVTIDIQVDTLDGQPLEVAGTSAAVPTIAALAAAFREAGRPIVHIVRLYREDASNVDLCRRAAVEAGAEMFVPGSSGSQLAPGVVERPAAFALQPDVLLDGRPQEVGPQEVVMYKPRWGAFYETPLEDHLRRRGVSTIVFCGCNFPNCPRTSIYEASERDFRVVLVEDAISGLYDRGREELENIGVRLMPAADVIASLRRDQVSARAGTAASSAGSPSPGGTDSAGSPVTVSPEPTG
jgi:nicotinamidase-related amidase